MAQKGIVIYTRLRPAKSALKILAWANNVENLTHAPSLFMLVTPVRHAPTHSHIPTIICASYLGAEFNSGYRLDRFCRWGRDV